MSTTKKVSTKMNQALALRKIKELEDGLAELRQLLTMTDEAVQVPRQGQWTAQMLRDLWPRVQHLPGVVALFEVTASNPNEVVAFHVIREASGLDDRQQANEHARLSRVTKELFGQKTWPIENWQDHKDGEMRYRMLDSVAQWWEALVAE